MSKKKTAPKDPIVEKFGEKFKEFLESQSEPKQVSKPKRHKDAFLAQCNCTAKHYDKETFDDFREIHEETPGHTFKVISQ